MEGLSSFAQLRPGRYIVVRRFGKNRLYRVTGLPIHGRFGWSVRAKRYVLSDRNVTVALFEKKLGYPPRATGGWIFEWFFTTKFWPLRMFRPRWHGFYGLSAAREYMYENPGFGVLDLLAKMVREHLPPWAHGFTLRVMFAVVLMFVPLHLQVLREHLEDTTAP